MSEERTAVLRALLAARERREAVATATVVSAERSVPRHSGASMLVRSDGTSLGSVGGGEMEARVVAEALAALSDGKTRLVRYDLLDPSRGDPGVCGGEVLVFVEPHTPVATVFVVGCGHVGRAVCELAHWLGFRVVATDDRADRASAEALPTADRVIAGTIEDALAAEPVDAHTHVVLVNRHMGVDVTVLPHLLATPAATIGVIGSSRRWAATRAALVEQSVPEEQLARVRTPIGLELGAETPEEIALSILGEIVAWRRSADRGG